jgi:hypothetical protein
VIDTLLAALLSARAGSRDVLRSDYREMNVHSRIRSEALSSAIFEGWPAPPGFGHFFAAPVLDPNAGTSGKLDGAG